MRRLALAFLLLCSTSSTFPTDAAVELNYRLQPSRDVTGELIAEFITSLRVIEDRGLVAKSQGRLSLLPTTVHMTSKQALRYITGEPGSDGSFATEMQVLDIATSLRGPDGKEQSLPERTLLKGLRVMAVVEGDGTLRANSVEVTGTEASVTQPLKQMMASILAQAASIAPILLTPDESVSQEVSMQVPLAGLASLDLKMRIANRLLGIERGVARIQQVYTLDFGVPSGPMKIAAEGSGGGSMLYEVATRTLLSSESGTLMKLLLSGEEGLLEIRINSKQVQKMRTTGSESR